MAFSARKVALDVSVFTIGGVDLLCDVENFNVRREVREVDAGGICDQDEFPYAVRQGWTAEGDLFVAASAPLMADADAQVTFTANTGANTYSGTGLLTTRDHSVTRDGLQKVTFTIRGQGPLSVS